jgi:peptidoglycan/xylan/chitin deacetylase (PgdA/CDA1 family)
MSAVFPVLLYHSVAERPNASWGAVSRAAFADHAEVIARSGRAPIGIAELAAGLRGERPLPDRLVAITFDDGYRDTSSAVELLGELGLSATIFVTSDDIDRPDRLSAEQVAHLAQLPGVEIGAHGVHHQHLDELDNDELTMELHASKSRLEEITARPIHSFAYPHGSYDRRVRDEVIAAGYRAAAAVKNAMSHPADDPFAIARWTVTAATTCERLAGVLEGRQVPLGWAVEPTRTRLYRYLRRSHRRLNGGRRSSAS